jgi:hypothetical protein
MITWADECDPPAEHIAHSHDALVDLLPPIPFLYGRATCEALSFTNNFSLSAANL